MRSWPAAISGTIVVACVIGRPVDAAAQRPPELPQWVVSVNVAWPATGSVPPSGSVKRPLYGETAIYEIAAPSIVPALTVDVGVSGRVWRQVGITVGFMMFQADARTAIAGSVPSPLFYNRPRTVVKERTMRHEYREQYVAAAWLIPITARSRLTVAGGPSLFVIERSFITDVGIVEGIAPYREVTIGRLPAEVGRGKGLGAHGSVDLTYLLTRRVGVGATIRGSAGTVVVSAGAISEAVRVGGLTLTAGLRIGF